MKFTQQQINFLYWALDMANNDDNWYYFNDDRTEIIMRKPDENAEDGWGEEILYTKEFIKDNPYFM